MIVDDLHEGGGESAEQDVEHGELRLVHRDRTERDQIDRHEEADHDHSIENRAAPRDAAAGFGKPRVDLARVGRVLGLDLEVAALDAKRLRLRRELGLEGLGQGRVGRHLLQDLLLVGRAEDLLSDLRSGGYDFMALASGDQRSERREG